MGDIWTTNDGRSIPVEQMDETHLLNASRWVERQLDLADRLASDSCAVAPVDALDWHPVDDRITRLIDNLFARRVTLRKEFTRRGLSFPALETCP